MLKNTLTAIGGLTIVALLGAAAASAVSGDASPAPTPPTPAVQSPSAGGGLRVADLPFSRSFHMTVSGNTAMQFPANAGVLITEIGATNVAGGTVTVTVNGAPVAKVKMPNDVSGNCNNSYSSKATQYQMYKYRFEPPLLVAPGSSFDIGSSGEVNLNGYQIYDTDL